MKSTCKQTEHGPQPQVGGSAWQIGPALPSARAYPAATTATDGTLYVIDGLDGTGLDQNTVYGFQPDTTAPTTKITLIPVGTANLTLQASAGVFTPNNQNLGTLSITCFDTRGLTVGLTATDASSGVASVTYSATGAQTIQQTTVTGATANPNITAPGNSTLTYSSTDKAGNVETARSEKVIVATDDDSGGRSFACGSPTTTFQMPNHGTLVASGTLTFFGHTFPFTNKTLHF